MPGCDIESAVRLVRQMTWVSLGDGRTKSIGTLRCWPGSFILERCMKRAHPEGLAPILTSAQGGNQARAGLAMHSRGHDPSNKDGDDEYDV